MNTMIPIADLQPIYSVAEVDRALEDGTAQRNEGLRSWYDRMRELGGSRYIVKPSSHTAVDDLYEASPNFGEVIDDLKKFLALAVSGNEAVQSVNPVVGECNDGFLSDIRRRPVGRDQLRQLADVLVVIDAVPPHDFVQADGIVYVRAFHEKQAATAPRLGLVVSFAGLVDGERAAAPVAHARCRFDDAVAELYAAYFTRLEQLFKSVPITHSKSPEYRFTRVDECW